MATAWDAYNQRLEAIIRMENEITDLVKPALLEGAKQIFEAHPFLIGIGFRSASEYDDSGGHFDYVDTQSPTLWLTEEGTYLHGDEEDDLPLPEEVTDFDIPGNDENPVRKAFNDVVTYLEGFRHADIINLLGYDDHTIRRTKDGIIFE